MSEEVVHEERREDRREEAFAWGRLKGALVRKYPELKQWLEERERAAGGFKNLVEELIYTAYLRERFGIKGMTLNDVMQALEVAGEIIDKARDVMDRLRGLMVSMSAGEGEEVEYRRSRSTEVRAELAKAMANVISSITSLIGMAVSSISAMTSRSVQMQQQQTSNYESKSDVDAEVSRALSEVSREIKGGSEK